MRAECRAQRRAKGDRWEAWLLQGITFILITGFEPVALLSGPPSAHSNKGTDQLEYK